jgi:hypothetical protein
VLGVRNRQVDGGTVAESCHGAITLEELINSVAGTLAGYGVLGAWATYLIWQSWQKDKIIERRDDRINDLMDRSAQREIDATKTLTELTILVRAIGGGKV